MVYADKLPVDPTPVWRSVAAFERMMDYYDKQILRITVPFETRFVETRFGTTHVIAAGDAAKPPLMLWHGMNINATAYIHWFNLLAHDFYMIAADTVGDAGKSAPTRMDKRNTVDYGRWAADVMDALGIARAHHAGISQGGWMQMQLAAAAPQKMISSSLISSAGFLPVRSTIALKVLPWLIFGTKAAAERMVRVMSGTNSLTDPEMVTVFELIFGLRVESGTPIMKDDDIRKLSAPTQLLMSEYEQTYSPYQVIARAKRLLPNLKQAEVLPGLSHGMSEKPDLVPLLVREFIRQVIDSDSGEGEKALNTPAKVPFPRGEGTEG